MLMDTFQRECELLLWIVNSCNVKAHVAMEDNGCHRKSLARDENQLLPWKVTGYCGSVWLLKKVNGCCYGKSLIAMETRFATNSQWLPWKGTVCYGKSMVALDFYG
jgi:hypothetical protein